jgi:3-oxoacyl-ACP reductase-like protein
MEVKVDLTPMENAILRENCESIKDLVLETCLLIVWLMGLMVYPPL